MTPEEFKNEMQKISNQLGKKFCDEEITHSKADDLMCDLLRELGYGEGVDVFKDMPKWYA